MGILGISSSVTLCFLVALFFPASLCDGGHTSSFVRKLQKSVDMPLHCDVFRRPSGYNAPQQVHITLGDHEGKGMIVSWVMMDEPGSSKVVYRKDESSEPKKKVAVGKHKIYKYYNYTSGYIHHCTIRNLEVIELFILRFVTCLERISKSSNCDRTMEFHTHPLPSSGIKK